MARKSSVTPVAGPRGRTVAAGVVLWALAACTPPPPFEPVNDPFARLPSAEPVTTAPLAAPGAISDEVIQREPGSPGGFGESPGAADTFTQDGGFGSVDPVQQEPLDGGVSDVVTEVTPGGLVERLPNTCQLENYQQFQNTDGLIAVGLVTDRPARLVAPGDIVSQLYDPSRVNFYTDADGRVIRISCG